MSTNLDWLDAEDDDDDDDGVLIDVELGLQQLVDCGEITGDEARAAYARWKETSLERVPGSRSSLGREKPRKARFCCPFAQMQALFAFLFTPSLGRDLA